MFANALPRNLQSKLIADRLSERISLHQRYINPKLVRALEIIEFDQTSVRGEGAYLWSERRERYLDLLSGYSVYKMRRNHPLIKQVIHEIIDLGRPNLIKMDCPLLAGLLAEALVQRISPGLDAVFSANSGAEAVETAIKFARAATGRLRILYLENAFHGLTLGALSINGIPAFREGLGPLIPGFDMVRMNDLEALERELRKGDVAAFIVEPIQDKGVDIPRGDYLPEAQRLCCQYGALFILQPERTGYGGRRGHPFPCLRYR